MTLVERLKKQINTNSLLPPPNFSEQLLDDISDSITALEQAQKALEPFAAYGEELSGPIWDRVSDDGSASMKGVPPFTLGDLRLARSILSKLRGSS